MPLIRAVARLALQTSIVWLLGIIAVLAGYKNADAVVAVGMVGSMVLCVCDLFEAVADEDTSKALPFDRTE